jgi:putative transposase
MPKEILKKYKYNPSHLFLDETYYMITTGTYKKIHHLKRDEDKKLLFEIITEFCDEFEWRLEEWVILNNHYHLMAKSRKGTDLPKLFGKIHRRSAYLLKRKNKVSALRFWWNYWDTCVRDERDFYSRINYIFCNPVKHGYVTNIEDYVWSSFRDFLRKNGSEMIRRQFQKYRFENLKVEDDF